MTTSPRVLITGAGGFVPRAIATALLRRGVQVVALDVAFDEALKTEWLAWGDRIRWIESPVEDIPKLFPNESFDALVHGAAITASPEERGETPEDNLRVNIAPLLDVLQWASSHVKRTVVISSSGIFRTTTGAVNEDDRPTPLGTYAVAKTLTESLADTLKTVYQRDIVCIRLSSIYGLGEQARPSRPRTSLVGRYLHQALTSQRIDVYSPDDARDWTFAPDVGEVVAQLLEVPALRFSLYNVASAQVITNIDWARKVQTAVPAAQIYRHDEPEQNSPAWTRRGWLTNARLWDEIGFSAWTLPEAGLRRCVDHWQMLMGLEYKS